MYSLATPSLAKPILIKSYNIPLALVTGKVNQSAVVCDLKLEIIALCSKKAMAPHSSTLAWKIPCMEEPGRLQSTGSQRVGHD